MDILTLDFETHYSKTFSLSKMTTEEYIRSPEFEVVGVSVQVNDGRPEWFSGTRAQTKEWLDRFDWDNSCALAHNAMFDMAILNWHFGIRPARIADTLSMGRALHGGECGVSLAALAKLYDIGEKGDEVVNALGLRRRDFSPQQLRAYGEYCCNDTALCYHLFKLMAPKFPVSELRAIDLVIRMFSEPALELDAPVLRAHLTSVVDAKEALLSKALIDKEQLMSNPKLAALLESIGVPAPRKISPTTGKETWAFSKTDQGFKDLLEHPNPMVQAIVAARLGVKSTLEETRTERFIGISERGTLPVPLRYYAAHTGRFGGDDKLNLQNLPRGSALKKAIVAPEGYVLVDCDSSQIEARTLAWLAGQDDLVDAFARGEDVYKIMASAIYAKDVAAIDKAERQVGKVTVLGAGYSMSWRKFVDYARTMSIKVEDAEAEFIIRTYRETYPCIPALWAEGQNAVRAMARQQAPVGFGRPGVVSFDTNGVRLPNGLHLKYPNLREVVNDETGKREFIYDTKKGRALVPTRLYGGKCLGGDTEVLTARGWVRITTVREDDLLWDGLEWVKHGGLIFQGCKATTVLDGVHMTPDHQVLTTEGWRAASSCEGLYRADFWVPDCGAVRGVGRPPLSVGVPVRLRDPGSPGSLRPREVRAQGGDSLLRVHGGRQAEDACDVEASGVLGMALHARPLPATDASGMAQLWGAWHSGMRSLGRIVRRLLGGHGPHVYPGSDVGPGGQQRGLRADELPMGVARSAVGKPAGLATGGHPQGPRVDGRFVVDSPVSVGAQPVYDIANAGPRTRFMVRGTSRPFVVHNCVENVVQALARIAVVEQMLMVARRYKVALTVHDSVVAMVRETEAEEATEFIEACMRIQPKWAVGLPLTCESHSGKTYGG